MPKKHRMVRIGAGRYNYRGYYIERFRRAWIVRAEEGGIFDQTRLLSVMRERLDKLENR